MELSLLKTSNTMIEGVEEVGEDTEAEEVKVGVGIMEEVDRGKMATITTLTIEEGVSIEEVAITRTTEEATSTRRMAIEGVVKIQQASQHQPGIQLSICRRKRSHRKLMTSNDGLVLEHE